MIRQAISCDICGAEKKQTNHWFVVNDQGGELRVSGWNARARLRAGTKHLCGQTCLHKLVDEFMARIITCRTSSPGAEPASASEPRHLTDASLTSRESHIASLAPQKAMPAPAVPPQPVVAAAVTVLPIQPRLPVAESQALSAPLRIEETPNYTSRRWRAEAWERERALHAVERRNESGARHRKLL